MDRPHDTKRKPTTLAGYQWTPVRIAAALAIIVAFCLGAMWIIRSQMRKMPRTYQPPAPNAQFDLSNLTIDEDAILSGGPTADGIPGLRTDRTTRPASAKPSRNEGQYDARIVSPDEAQDVAPAHRVVGLELGGEVRAYPVDVLTYHEIVNDVLGGVPIAIVYCPLCDSLSVVDRRMDDDVLEFGTSGMLTDSNVLMYDRRDHALWSQLHFTAISGPLAGRSLRHINQWQITTYANWLARYPQTTVLSRDTGHNRAYDTTPYIGYFDTDDVMFPVDHSDDRLANKTRVVGVQYENITRAYVVDAIDGTLDDDIAGQPLRIGRSPESDHVEIMAAPHGAKVVHTFWFAWVAFHPDTQIVGLDAK